MARRKSARTSKPPPSTTSSSDEIEDSEDFIELPVPKKTKPANIPWLEKYRPRDCKSVCINPRKAKEVKDILASVLNGTLKCRLLVFSGPVGSSKSTLAKCLANELIGLRAGKDSVVEYTDSVLSGVGQIHFFSQFMDECRYLVGKNKALVLIEDLPNVFHKDTLNSFRASLRDWIFSPEEVELPPVVLCLSELEISGDRKQRSYNIENTLTVETLLGGDLLYKASALGLVKRVKFAPIARTFMRKTLVSIMSEEKLNPKDPGLANFLESSYESGDIRSSICNLEFWAGTNSLALLETFHRENQITLFHAIGKIIHSSSKYGEKFSEADKIDYESIQTVLNNYSDSSLLQLGLLENYHIYNGSQFDINIASKIVDSLSINDTMNGAEEGEDFALRSTRNELRKVETQPGRTMPMKFPRHFKSLMEGNKVRKEISLYTRYMTSLEVSFSDANLYDGYYLPHIRNAFRYRLKHGQKRYRYNRLGGLLKEIYAEEGLTVMELEEDESESLKDQMSEDIKDKVLEETSSKSDGDELSDSIEDSSSDEELEDDLDDQLLTFATQKPMPAKSQHSDQFSDDFSDDVELDRLVSQGRL